MQEFHSPLYPGSLWPLFVQRSVAHITARSNGVLPISTWREFAPIVTLARNAQTSYPLPFGKMVEDARRISVLIAETPALRNSTPSLLKRRCPDCGSLLLLEAEYGDGYWWNCLICGWHKPAEGMDPRRTGAATR